jgi:transcriptional regulator with XRE-family HTH domain
MSKSEILPNAVAKGVAAGIHVVRASREHLGYTVEELAIACGLTAEEISNIEAGHRYEKGYRERIARALSLPDQTFSESADELPDAA